MFFFLDQTVSPQNRWLVVLELAVSHRNDALEDVNQSSTRWQHIHFRLDLSWTPEDKLS